MNTAFLCWRINEVTECGVWGCLFNQSRKENWHERARKCVLMLSVHGFITQAESNKAQNRINKWLEQKQQPGESSCATTPTTP